MLKKIVISALIAIALVSGSIMRAESTSGNSGQHKTGKHRHGKGFRKKGGEQERPLNTTGTRKGLNPQPLPPGMYSGRRGHRGRH